MEYGKLQKQKQLVSIIRIYHNPYCSPTYCTVKKSTRIITIARHQQDKQGKAASSFFPNQMVAKQERTQNNAQQNMKQAQNLSIGVIINNGSTTTALPPKNGQQPKPLGGLNAFYWYQFFALDSAVVETQKLSSHGGFLTTLYSMNSSQRNNLFKLTHYDEIQKRAHDLQIVRGKTTSS